MSATAFVLVLIAAFAHSGWNILAKRAAHCKHFIWFSSAGEACLLLPVATYFFAVSWPQLGWIAAVFLLATGILHFVYMESLLHGYRVGDLSVVYPLARGTGPLLAFVGAVVILGEHTSAAAVIGAVLVTVGIVVISDAESLLRKGASRAGIHWGLVTGFTIACYTLVDGYSVKVLLLSPFLIEYSSNLFRTIVLSGGAWRERASLPFEYRQFWKEALGVSLLTPAGYILVLYAMRIAPISHVAPIREISMIIGAYWGARFLHEGNYARRIAGAAIIAAGVVALALG